MWLCSPFLHCRRAAQPAINYPHPAKRDQCVAMTAIGTKMRNNLTKAVMNEIGPELMSYVISDGQLDLMSVQITLTYKQ